MYHILIAGAGYTGSAIARYFLQEKQKVFVMTRSEKKAAAFHSEGLHPLCMDLTRPETLKKTPAAHFIVFAAAPDTSEEMDYRKTYLEGLTHFIEAVRNNPKPFLFLYLSSTSVWRERAGAWVDETIPADPDSIKGSILLEAEQLALHSGLPSAVLRLAGIYGPGRNRLQRKPAAAVENLRWMNMVHVEDIARAAPILFKCAREGGIYTAVDDEPVLNRDFYAWLKGRTGIVWPGVNPSDEAKGKRVSNQLLKSLNWKPDYPNFRSGYEAFLKTGQEPCV